MSDLVTCGGIRFRLLRVGPKRGMPRLSGRDDQLALVEWESWIWGLSENAELHSVLIKANGLLGVIVEIPRLITRPISISQWYI